MKTLSKSAMLRASVAPMILGAALLSSPAFAQDPQAADAADTGDAIIVTGSLIKNPNLTQATPVNTTTSDTIELKQNNTAEDILREIPGVVPSIGSAVNNGNGGQSFVNLRGLGSNRNLVLLDGNRIVPGDLAGRVDLNNIPLALVERVDVLTGGASTTYGADAITGVVNFITKTDFAGLEASASEQITEQGDGNYLRTDVTIGGNFDDGKGNAVLSLGYQESDPVYQGDRDFAFSNISSFTGAASGSGTSIPARFTGVNIAGVDNGNATRQVNPATGTFSTTTQLFNFNPYNIFQTPFKRYNVFAAAHYDVSDAVEVYTRALFSKNTVRTIIAPSGAFGIGVNLPLSNPYLTTAQRNAFCAFDVNPAVGIYTPRFTPAQCAAAATATSPSDPNYRAIGVGNTFVPFDLNNDGTITRNFRGEITEGYNTNPQTVLSLRAVDVGPRVSEFQSTVFDYRLGARGGITDTIDWDVSGSYGESEQLQFIQGYTLNSRFRQALLATNTTTCIDTSNACVPVNVFGGTGSITPAMAAFLTANSSVRIRTTLAQVHAQISGDIGTGSPLASDPISFAIGGEYRSYSALQRGDILTKTGDLGGAGGATPDINGGYDVYEAIAEVGIPLVQDKPFFEDLSITAGVRYSAYSIDTAGSPSFNTTTYKVAGSWEPVSGLKLRGNYSHAVRAPNIGELFTPVTTGLTSLGTDPCAGAIATNANLAALCVAQGAPAASIGSIANPTAAQANVTSGGNAALSPEKSNSYGFGATWQPEFLPGFSMSVDYYNIKITGAISSPSAQDVINACFGPRVGGTYTVVANQIASNASCATISRNTLTGGLDGDATLSKGLIIPTTNQGRFATDGIDVNLNYSRDIGFANLGLSFNGNWTNNSKFQASPISTAHNCVGKFSTSCASIQPEYSTSTRVTLGFEDVDVSFLWRYLSKQRSEDGDSYVGPVAALGGKTYDFNKIKAFSYFDLSTRFNVVENITFTITVQNLLDKKPPIVGTNVGTVSFNSGNTYPSTYDTLGRRYAASVKLKF